MFRGSQIRTAFFDLDFTVIEQSSGVELAKILSSLEKDPSKWKGFWESQNLFKDPNTSYDDAIEKLSDLFAHGVRNLSVERVQQSISKLGEKIIVRKHFSDLYSWLVKNKLRTFVLTASPNEVFGAIRGFCFTKTYGLVLEKNGKYSGRCLLAMTTNAKRRIIHERIKSSVFSFGVTDSVHDLDAYEELGIAFLLGNPPSKSRRYKSVASFLDVKRIVEQQLKARPKN